MWDALWRYNLGNARDLFPDELDVCGCTSGHELPLFIKPIERRDFPREVPISSGVLVGAV